MLDTDVFCQQSRYPECLWIVAIKSNYHVGSSGFNFVYRFMNMKAKNNWLMSKLNSFKLVFKLFFSFFLRKFTKIPKLCYLIF